jgi:hypothetical protein
MRLRLAAAMNHRIIGITRKGTLREVCAAANERDHACREYDRPAYFGDKRRVIHMHKMCRQMVSRSFVSCSARKRFSPSHASDM